MNAVLTRINAPQPPSRLQFLAVHLYELQTLRWLGVHLSLICCPALFLVPQPWQTWSLLSLMVAFTAVWFFRFRRAMRTRFGVTRLTLAERTRLRYPSPLLALVPAVFLLAHVYCRYVLGMHSDDFIFGWAFVLWFMAPVVNRSNPMPRRLAYAAALITMASAYTFFSTRELPDWQAALFFSVMGTVLLALALFDYHLLRRAATGEHLHPEWTA